MEPIRVLTMTCVLTAGLLAQGEGAGGTETRDAAAALTPLQRVLSATADERPAALETFIEDQIATNAVYAGQYAGLREIRDDVLPLAQGWTVEAPDGVADAVQFRVACIQLLRDILQDDVPEAVAKSLKELATDEFEQSPVRSSAVFALAQFGDRELVNAMIANAMKLTSATNAQQRFTGWNTLSGIYYNLREYDSAVKAYKQAIRLLENAGQKDGMEGIYYNCACSMALAGQTDDALEYVEKAMKTGQANGTPLSRRMLDSDMDIATLREDERFTGLLEKYYGAREERQQDTAVDKDDHD